MIAIRSIHAVAKDIVSYVTSVGLTIYIFFIPIFSHVGLFQKLPSYPAETTLISHRDITIFLSPIALCVKKNSVQNKWKNALNCYFHARYCVTV